MSDFIKWLLKPADPVPTFGDISKMIDEEAEKLGGFIETAPPKPKYKKIENSNVLEILR